MWCKVSSNGWMLFALLHLNHYTLGGVENGVINSKRINFIRGSKSSENSLITKSLIYHNPKETPFFCCLVFALAVLFVVVHESNLILIFALCCVLSMFLSTSREFSVCWMKIWENVTKWKIKTEQNNKAIFVYNVKI